MALRVSSSSKAATTRRTETKKRLPPISIGATLSKKIDKAIIDVGAHRQRQLKFTSKLGFVSPSGNPLQVVYLTPAATKSGLNITYVDARAKQFWAQAPGVSGFARGPFKLPSGIGSDLAKATARELKPAKQPAQPRNTSDDFGGRGRVYTSDSGGNRGGVWRSDGSGGGYVDTGGGGGGGGGS